MGIFIHREAKFNKCLNILKKSGGKASLAARRAEEIIQELATKSGMTREDFSRLTKHGELRIDKCKKYDLGGGYRLVGLKKGEHLILSYAGTHDDCDRWLENNRGFEPVIVEGAPDISALTEYRPIESVHGEEQESQSDHDDLLMERIDERTLRSIFRGLCGGTQR